MTRYTCKLCNKSFLVEENMKRHFLQCNKKPREYNDSTFLMLQSLISYIPCKTQPEKTCYRFYSFKQGTKPGYYLSAWYSKIIEDSFTFPDIYMTTLAEILKVQQIISKLY